MAPISLIDKRSHSNYTTFFCFFRASKIGNQMHTKLKIKKGSQAANGSFTQTYVLYNICSIICDQNSQSTSSK